MSWETISVNKNNIEHETCKSMLIKMPNKSAYAGFKFWHPKKLVRDKGYFCTISFTEEFVFKLFKNGQGKYNFKDIVASKEIDACEMKEAFGGGVFVEKKEKNPFETRTPESLEPEESKELEELLDE